MHVKNSFAVYAKNMLHKFFSLPVAIQNYGRAADKSLSGLIKKDLNNILSWLFFWGKINCVFFQEYMQK
jgi:hypothetical protein